LRSCGVREGGYMSAEEFETEGRRNDNLLGKREREWMARGSRSDDAN
jgi:hypothetical protein